MYRVDPRKRYVKKLVCNFIQRTHERHTMILVIPTNARINVMYILVGLLPLLKVSEGFPTLRTAKSKTPWQIDQLSIPTKGAQTLTFDKTHASNTCFNTKLSSVLRSKRLSKYTHISTDVRIIVLCCLFFLHLNVDISGLRNWFAITQICQRLLVHLVDVRRFRKNLYIDLRFTILDDCSEVGLNLIVLFRSP